MSDHWSFRRSLRAAIRGTRNPLLRSILCLYLSWLEYRWGEEPLWVIRTATRPVGSPWWYWSGRHWTTDPEAAQRFATEDRAERAALVTPQVAVCRWRAVQLPRAP